MGAMAIIGYLAAAAVFVVMLICLINSVRIKRRGGHRGAKPALEASASERLRYAAALSRMIQVPTVSGKGGDPGAFERLHDVMQSEFPLIFERLERVEIKGNLLFKWPGDGRMRDAIMLMGHQDVVPASGAGWAYPPFSGAIANGRVYGRGALDCKCTVAAEFFAVEELLAAGFAPACDVYLSSSVDEEVSGGGAALLAEHLRNEGAALSLVLDEGGAIVEQAFPGLKRPCAMVGVSEKGYMDVKITAKSHGGHSSAPARNSPIVRLAGFICHMERIRPFDRRCSLPVTAMFKRMAPDLSFGMRFLLGNLWLFRPLITALLPRISPYGEALLSTSFAFTMCGGSSAPNVIPHEAHVICNLRLSPHEDADAALGRIRKHALRYGLEAEALEARNASQCADMAGKGYGAVERCLTECFPDIAVAPYLIMGGTDCREYEALSRGCIRLCPVRMDRDQLESTHGVNENIHIAALGDAVKFYRRLIETYR